jgi:probable HAF family extracellular repeat protein
MVARRVAATIIFVLLFGSAAFAQQVRYRVVDLGQVDGTASVATGINDNGEVSGWIITQEHEQRAVKAWSNTPFYRVPGLEMLFAVANGINANGDLAVDVQVSPWPNVVTRAMRYYAATTTLEDLDPAAPGNTYGFGINTARSIAGYTGTWNAFVAIPGPPLRYLGSFGGAQSVAYAVNDPNGVVVGWAQTASGASHAFRFDGSMVDLNPANATSSEARAINIWGQITGSMVVNGELRVFRYRDETGVQDLGAGTGYAINDRGQVVGDFRTAVWPHAFVYSDEAGLVDLNTANDPASGWLLTHAYGINSRGEIVGEGLFGSQFTSRAFRLVPADLDLEPPTITAAAVNPAVLWPPNGQMVPVTISVQATDDMDPAPVCSIGSVFADELVAPVDDAVMTGPLSLLLRARRVAATADRVYTISVGCRDAAANVTVKNLTVVVPHDNGSGGS